MKEVDPNQDKSEDRWVSLANASLGVPPMLIGGLWILYFYALSSMVDPSLEGWVRAKAILERMIPSAIPGVFLAFLGTAFFLSSIAYAAFGLDCFRPTLRKGLVLLGLAVIVSVFLFAFS